jgi:hypothetical protein
MMTQWGFMVTMSSNRARLIATAPVGDNSMKRTFVVLSTASGVFGGTPVWAQGTAAFAGAQSAGSTDTIVRMRSAIRAANAAYRANLSFESALLLTALEST